MTGPEHAQSPPEKQTRAISREEADRLIADAVLHLPSRRAAKRLLNLYEQSGPPVAVFLTFEGVDPGAENFEEQFHGNYFGSFTRDEVIQTGIEIAELDVALERFLDDQGLPENALDWDYDAIWPFIRDRHLLVEEGEYFHVFDAGLVWPEKEADR